MVAHWIVFSLLLIAFPIGLASIKVWAEKRNTFTEQQKKTANVRLARYMLFYWLADLFYMATFNGWLAWQFIFGGLVMIIIFCSLASGVMNGKNKDGFTKYGMIQDFIVGIGLSVYLLFLIPNDKLQTVMVAVVSAVYGGIITLVGVAWTIKQTEKTRNEDKIQLAKPIFAIRPANKEVVNFINTKCYASKSSEYQNGCFFYIENANINSFRLVKVHHDNLWYNFEGYTQFIPNDKMLIGFMFHEKTEIKMAIVDQIGMEHFYELKIDPIIDEHLRSNKRDIGKAFTVIEIKEICPCII